MSREKKKASSKKKSNPCKATMDDIEASEYWCHVCSQVVNPIVEIETIKCPICQSGFVEEMSSAAGNDDAPLGDSDSDHALHLWGPILLGMLGNRRHRRRFRRMEFDSDENEYDYENENENNPSRFIDGEAELDRELDSLMRRTRNTAALLELLRGIRAGIVSESEQARDRNTNNQNNTDSDDRDGERVILINPFNQTIVVRGSSNDSSNPTRGQPIGSLGDYFMGPGLETLLQHLAENDPNRYGTPPAKKEAVEALAAVKIEEAEQCSVCLDDMETGDEAKEMPCKHKFHGDCLLPWLELHSSCPVCRYQLPCDESKVGRDRDEGPTRNNDVGDDGGEENEGNVDDDDGDDEDDGGGSRQFSLPLPWPFGNLFSSSSTGSQSSDNGNSSPSSRYEHADEE